MKVIPQKLKSSFLKGVLTLLSGTVLAQLIVILSTPFLTRIYGPTEFAYYTLFISIYAILNSIVSFKYELSLPLVKNKYKFDLLKTNILISFIVIFFITLSLFIVNRYNLYKVVNIGDEYKIIWIFIPVLLLVYSIFTNTNYYLIREKKYKKVANLNIFRSISKVTLQIFFGLAGGLSLGLIIGEIVGGLFLIIYIYIYIYRKKNIIKSLDLKKSRLLIKKYQKFPIYTMPASLINSLGTHLTPIFIISLFGPVIGGLYALTHRVLTVPVSFIGVSISQAYLSRAPELYRINPKMLTKSYLKISGYLVFATIPIILISLFGEDVFRLVFGEEWKEAGEYLKALVFLYIGQVVVAPLSQTLNIINKNQIQLLWDCLRLLVVLIIFLVITPWMDFMPLQTMYLYSISMFLLYVLLFLTTLFILLNSEKK